MQTGGRQGPEIWLRGPVSLDDGPHAGAPETPERPSSIPTGIPTHIPASPAASPGWPPTAAPASPPSPPSTAARTAAATGRPRRTPVDPAGGPHPRGGPRSGDPRPGALPPRRGPTRPGPGRRGPGRGRPRPTPPPARPAHQDHRVGDRRLPSPLGPLLAPGRPDGPPPPGDRPPVPPHRHSPPLSLNPLLNGVQDGPTSRHPPTRRRKRVVAVCSLRPQTPPTRMPLGRGEPRDRPPPARTHTTTPNPHGQMIARAYNAHSYNHRTPHTPGGPMTRRFLFVLGSARLNGNTELLARRAAEQLPPTRSRSGYASPTTRSPTSWTSATTASSAQSSPTRTPPSANSWTPPSPPRTS